MHVSVVITVIGPDRPGIVRMLADRGRAFDANWAESRMASLGGQFAGIVRWEVLSEKAESMIAGLRELESSDLRIVIAQVSSTLAVGDRRLINLELVGHDRPGIVQEVARALLDRDVSIEELETEFTSGAWSGEKLFKAVALLSVPHALTVDALREALEALANEFMVDLNAQEEGGAR
ncbi:MAG TPA: ACT domain-containing protein [Casimicrobiaceae bacterium]